MPEINELAFLEEELAIDTIKPEFTFSRSAKKQVTNAHDQFLIKYDDKAWKRIPPATLNEEAEFAFQCKKSDVWCAVISEETPIAADKLYRIAIKNMEDHTGTKVDILKSELRTVNGHEVVRGVLRANLSGITFVFDSYYFSNEKGSVQFTTWTSDSVYERVKDDIAVFLNGLVVN